MNYDLQWCLYSIPLICLGLLNSTITNKNLKSFLSCSNKPNDVFQTKLLLPGRYLYLTTHFSPQWTNLYRQLSKKNYYLTLVLVTKLRKKKKYIFHLVIQVRFCQIVIIFFNRQIYSQKYFVKDRSMVMTKQNAMHHDKTRRGRPR